MTIHMHSIVGPICIDSHDGERIRQQIALSLTRGERVVVDCAGVAALTSGFLNAAIGRLYGQFEVADLDARLHLVGLDEDDHELVRLVQNNARRFYSVSPEQREKMLHADADLLQSI